MRCKSLFLLLLLGLVVAPTAWAFYPASGFYWNPQIPGRGYAIEVQDRSIFIAVYAYDQARIPFWFTAQGQLLDGNGNPGDFRYVGELDVADNGTCVGCSFSQPSVDLGAGGPFVLEFLDKERARLEWDGGVEILERFNYALGDVHQRMLGEWTFMLDFSRNRGDEFPYDGDVLIFDVLTGSGSNETFDGCRPDSSQAGECSNFALNNHDAAGAFNPDTGDYVLVVSDAPGFKLAYFLDIGLERATGVVQVFADGSNPSGPDFPVRGYRTASRSFVQGGAGPAKAASQGALDGLVARHQGMLEGEVSQRDPSNLRLAVELIEKLEAED